jgi:uronate dehydrogenase
VQCDLADKAAVMKMRRGSGAALRRHLDREHLREHHAGEYSGTANLYEAAHKKGVKRIIFASSNHTVGFYRNTDYIDATAPTRPDSSTA